MKKRKLLHTLLSTLLCISISSGPIYAEEISASAEEYTLTEIPEEADAADSSKESDAATIPKDAETVDSNEDSEVSSIPEDTGSVDANEDSEGSSIPEDTGSVDANEDSDTSSIPEEPASAELSEEMNAASGIEETVASVGIEETDAVAGIEETVASDPPEEPSSDADEDFLDEDFLDEDFLENEFCQNPEALLQTYTFPSDLPGGTFDPDDYYLMYTASLLNSAYGISPFNTYFGDNLTGFDAKVYSAVKKQIIKIAEGTRTSTDIEISMKTLGLPSRLYGSDLGIGKITEYPEDLASYNIIYDALTQYLNYSPVKVGWTLVRDCPYEFYWFDLTFTYSASGNFQTYYDSTKKEYYLVFNPSFGFEVNEAFRGSDLYETNAAKTSLAKTAIENAQKIVSDAASLSDLEKLIYYRDMIIALTDYNYEAAWRSSETEYGYGYDGNPWQLLWVFDNDPFTEVVCEGYAKAFQYLCDLTTFEHPNIQCYTVTGDFDFGCGPEAHMWNILHMSDGKNYLVDVTNCDKGGSSVDPALFMAAPFRGSPSDGYFFHIDDTDYHYLYDTGETAPLYLEEQITLTDTVFDEEHMELPVLSAPELTGIKNSKTGITLKWNTVDGAEKYCVFRKTSGSSWKRIAVTTSCSYTDETVTSGTTYCYTVRCRDFTDTVYTSSFDPNGLKLKYIKAPTLSSVTNGYSGVVIKWTSSTGAEKYRVLRKTSGGSWTAIGSTDSSTASYTDKTAVSGTTYSYTVRCMDASGKTYTSDYNSKGLSTTYIAAPKLTGIKCVSKGVYLKWKASPGAAKYRVYRKTSGGSWKRLKDTTATSYTDKTPVSGKTYQYTVRCISKDSKTMTSSFHPTGLKKTYIAAPVLTSVQNTASGIKITWKKSNGAVKYRVYRKTPGGSYKKLKDTKSNSFIDKTAAAGKKYTYTVRCISSTGANTSSYYPTGLTITRK